MFQDTFKVSLAFKCICTGENTPRTRNSPVTLTWQPSNLSDHSSKFLPFALVGSMKTIHTTVCGPNLTLVAKTDREQAFSALVSDQNRHLAINDPETPDVHDHLVRRRLYFASRPGSFLYQLRLRRSLVKIIDIVTVLVHSANPTIYNV